MGAAPAPPAAALQRGVRAVAATPRAGVARRGGGGARGRGLGVLALCAASELLHEHPPLVHAVVVRAQLERLGRVVEALLRSLVIVVGRLGGTIWDGWWVARWDH